MKKCKHRRKEEPCTQITICQHAGCDGKPPLYYTKVCPVEKTEEGDAEYYIPSFVRREGRLLWASEYGIIPTVGKMAVNSYDR